MTNSYHYQLSAKGRSCKVRKRGIEVVVTINLDRQQGGPQGRDCPARA